MLVAHCTPRLHPCGWGRTCVPDLPIIPWLPRRARGGYRGRLIKSAEFSSGFPAFSASVAPRCTAWLLCMAHSTVRGQINLILKFYVVRINPKIHFLTQWELMPPPTLARLLAFLSQLVATAMTKTVEVEVVAVSVEMELEVVRFHAPPPWRRGRAQVWPPYSLVPRTTPPPRPLITNPHPPPIIHGHTLIVWP